MIAILAIGSPFGADRVGWQIAEHMNRRGFKDIHTCRHPIDLIPHFEHYEHCVVIDALWAFDEEDSELIAIRPGELRKDYCPNSHDLSLWEVVQLATISEQLPPQFEIFGINISKRPKRVYSSNEIEMLATKLTDLLEGMEVESA